VRLGVRVPALPSVAAALGYDVETWAGEGLVDLVVVSSFLLADEGIPYADWAERIRRRAPGVVVLPALDRLLAGGRRCPSYDTDMEISRAWAANMVAEGAPGAYLFNFPYLNSDECPETAWTRMPERIYAEGFLPGEVVRGARRYALAYHDCTAGGIPDGAQLPVPSGTGTNLFVRIAHNPAPGETVGAFSSGEVVWCDVFIRP
ncbi:MAG TPA: hypothetical protein PKI32_03045, partial [Opitutales bacterium]|nr:hypothetical protein [Opitutales bacterium]